MRSIFQLLFVTFLISCSQDERLVKYNSIVDKCDKVRIYKSAYAESTLLREISNQDDLRILKQILKRKIEPEIQRKFIPSMKYELIKDNKQIGVLLINDSNEDPFVNFQNEDFGFGFKLTYGIGTYLN
jgi:hypothetical protein